MVRTTPEGILRGNFGNDRENDTPFRVPSAFESPFARYCFRLVQWGEPSSASRLTSHMVSSPPHMAITYPP